jgi:hypothetical protein
MRPVPRLSRWSATGSGQPLRSMASGGCACLLLDPEYETEAEAGAYVLGGLAGLDTSSYSTGYIAGWTRGDLATVKDTATNVLRAVHQLAPAFTCETDQTGEPQ